MLFISFRISNRAETVDKPGPVTGGSGIFDKLGSARISCLTFFMLLARFSLYIGSACAENEKCISDKLKFESTWIALTLFQKENLRWDFFY